MGVKPTNFFSAAPVYTAPMYAYKPVKYEYLAKVRPARRVGVSGCDIFTGQEDNGFFEIQSPSGRQFGSKSVGKGGELDVAQGLHGKIGLVRDISDPSNVHYMNITDVNHFASEKMRP